MPELPEVETVRRGLERRVLGRRITRVEVSHPQVIAGSVEDFEQHVRGYIRGFDRKGKAIAIELDPGLKPAARKGGGPSYLLVRLGMTGQVTVLPANHPLEPHTHVRLTLENGEEIRYRDIRRFGRLRWCSQAEMETVFSGLGPDAPSMPVEEFVQALKGRRTPIKSWLLNQSRLAGVGNIYADEALFEARIHPLTEAGLLKRSAASALHRAVVKVLQRAVAKQGTSFRDYVDIEGQPGRFAQSLKVYQRTGEPCPRCGRKIRRLVLSGRSSHFCPRCQPRSRRAAVVGRAGAE
ncbi:MAG TPA: bifunctional DNA-formamidopyrimidine glycosylase/DNA-(apurinic or apyrimidinic site) lyase [Terriglobia bacterium]|nr:bifunctional DNA-formamidopyrimidine glycosylase/DNA-(apurinic or apyrimidinic site) lyase [Terriglobia bacterium]